MGGRAHRRPRGVPQAPGDPRGGQQGLTRRSTLRRPRPARRTGPSASPDGNIWTAYGDEGIFGSHPESRGALAGWGPDGRALWSPRQPFPEGPVNGSTAATDGAYVWTAWYCRSGTYLTRITPATGETRSWPTPLRRVDGLAVRGDRAVLTSREHDRPWTEVVRIELRDNGTCAVTGRDRQRLPGHVVMHCGQGRDGTLLLRAGDTWVRIEA
ncbi:hypothetical protein ACWGCI_34555 [Streptomyces sp. NPDC054949]|uniref:hypothetical protein n=1 Tax=Streptomyces sp. WM4235 TaxID=1415551 RepID=UPI00131C98B0|nr:hypothetical protein [Streptomyces sp. WM4235]